MTTQCDIVFDNNANKVYFGGQVVTGEVVLTLAKDKIIRGAPCLKFNIVP